MEFLFDVRDIDWPLVLIHFQHTVNEQAEPIHHHVDHATRQTARIPTLPIS